MTRLKPMVAALLLAVVAAACGADNADVSADRASDTVTLTLVTHDSFVVSDGVFESFTAATGTEVRVFRGGDAGSALNQAILTKSNPEGDVFFGVDNTLLSRALDEGLFAPHEAVGLDAVDPALVLDDQFRVTPIDTGDVCLNYDIAALEALDVAPPTSLDDLIDPTYEGLTVVENPASSSPGLSFLLATVDAFGEDGYEAYWQAMRDNDVEVVAGWDEAYYGSFTRAGGDRPIVVSYASSPPAEVFFAETPIDTPPTAVVLDTCFRQIEFAGVIAATEHPDEAGALVDFLLSPTFQADIPLNMFVFPVTDVDLPDVFVEHAEVAENPHFVDPATIAEHRDEWIEAWTDVVLR